MIDVNKQVIYWRDGAVEDWDVANMLVKNGRIRHGMFFAHLALEKALKAHVSRATDNLAPKSHDLLRLANLAKLVLTQQQQETLTELDAYQLEGRYPQALPIESTSAEAREVLHNAGEVFQWLMKQL